MEPDIETKNGRLSSGIISKIRGYEKGRLDIRTPFFFRVIYESKGAHSARGRDSIIDVSGGFAPATTASPVEIPLGSVHLVFTM
jgi:hypothetical protein